MSFPLHKFGKTVETCTVGETLYAEKQVLLNKDGTQLKRFFMYVFLTLQLLLQSKNW
jgi:hypothetical protein